jgi:hypothetical protein
MAEKYYWIGSVGPYIYDDTNLYPDGTPHVVVHGEVGHVTEDPLEDIDIANKKYVDDKVKKSEGYKVGDVCFNVDGVDPGVKLGYGTWALIGSGNLVLT